MASETGDPRQEHALLPVPAGRLSGRVVIVTGSTRGLGRAMAERLATEGARVVVVGRSAAGVDGTVAELRERTGEVIGIPADVSVEGEVHHLVERTLELWDRVDVLVNNAGAYALRPWDELTVEEFDESIRTNLRSVFLCCKAVHPTMLRQGKGKIINVASGVVYRGVTQLAHYTTAKAGVIGLTRALARELGPKGITVNAVSPGLVATEGVLAAYPPERIVAYEANRSIPRPQRPEDLAGAVAFLASDDSDFITGQTVLVDGGNIML